MTALAPPSSGAGSSPPYPPPAGRPRRRIVLWVASAVAVIAAVLVAVLATSGPTGQMSAHSPLIGKAAPPVAGPNLVAPPETIRVAGPQGRWVLVNFAASWCVPCQQEMPQLLLFAARHARTGDARIVTVAYQEGDERALASYFRSRHAAWPVIDDNQAKVSYGVTGIPESYLIDPQGRVVAKVVDGVVADQIDALINAVPAGPPASGGGPPAPAGGPS